MIRKPSNTSRQFDRWANCSTEELNNMSKLTKLIRGWTRHRSHTSCLLDTYSSCNNHSHSSAGYSEPSAIQDTLHKLSHLKFTTGRWFSWTIFYSWGNETHSNFRTCGKSLRSLSQNLNLRLPSVVLRTEAVCPSYRAPSAATKTTTTMDLHNNTLNHSPV